jgi:glycosyltransferase involved in cell wall biosynthesis
MPERMKIPVALIERYCPHYRVPVYNKLSLLSRHSWSFQFGVHPGRGSGGLDTKIDHLRPHRLTNHWLGRRYCWQSGIDLADRGIKALVFELNYSILSNPWLLTRARLHGIRCIGWGKGISESGQRRSLAKRLAERIHLAGCDAFLVYGETSRLYYKALGIPPERIFIAQNTTDTMAILGLQKHAAAESLALRSRHFPGDSRPIIGYLGRLVPEKRVDAIIRAFADVIACGGSAILVIAGDGPELCALRQQVDRLACRESVRFIPDVPEGAEHGFFQMFDVYVSFAVGGLGLMEAMAHGRAIVSTPEIRPELDLLVSGETAYLARDFSIASFTESLRAAISNKADRTAMGARARTRVMHQATQEKMVESFDRAVDFAVGL